jgi:hypothetical protein
MLRREREKTQNRREPAFFGAKGMIENERERERKKGNLGMEDSVSRQRVFVVAGSLPCCCYCYY